MFLFMQDQKQLPNSYTSNGQGFWLALLKSLKHKLLVMLQKSLLLSQKVSCAKLYWKTSSPSPPPLKKFKKKQKRSTRHNRDENPLLLGTGFYPDFFLSLPTQN